MNVKYQQALTAIVALAMTALAPLAHGAIVSPITGWAVHNGSSTPGGTPSNPTFTPGDNITLMAPFDDIELANDGDYVEVSVDLTMNNRSTTGVNTLNTQLRIGMFDGPAGVIVANDVPNLGFIIEYTNQGAGGLIREQESALQTSPFILPTNIGNGTADSDSIAGANPPLVTFVLRMTRNAGELDLTGSITGGSHLANYSVTGHSSTNFPANGTFNFNRIGLYLGDGVNAADASLANAVVETNVPEPQSICLAALAAFGCFAVRSRRRHASSRS